MFLRARLDRPCPVALTLALAATACGDAGGGGTTQSSNAGTTTGLTSAGTDADPTTQAPTGGQATGTGASGTTGDGATTAPLTTGATTDPGTTSAPGTTGDTTGDGVSGSSTGDGGGSSGGGDGPLPPLPSPGCGLAGAPVGHFDGLTTVVDGVDRSYDLFVPQPYDPDKPHAVIFTYHGVGGTANTNQLKLDTFSTNNGGYSINVAPQGWPSAEWPENHFVPFNLDASLTVFDQVLAELGDKYCVDLNRIYATGHSNGGQMAFHLGCLRGDVVRAVFPSGGRCFSYGPGVCDPYHDLANQCVGEVMVMSVMGEDDVERHADEEATLAGFTARQGCSDTKEPVAPSPCLQFTGCDDGAEVMTCRIPGLAHQIWKDGLADVYAVMMSL